MTTARGGGTPGGGPIGSCTEFLYVRSEEMPSTERQKLRRQHGRTLRGVPVTLVRCEQYGLQYSTGGLPGLDLLVLPLAEDTSS